jgi:hypothetical protein
MQVLNGTTVIENKYRISHLRPGSEIKFHTYMHSQADFDVRDDVKLEALLGLCK